MRIAGKRTGIVRSRHAANSAAVSVVCPHICNFREPPTADPVPTGLASSHWDAVTSRRQQRLAGHPIIRSRGAFAPKLALSGGSLHRNFRGPKKGRRGGLVELSKN